MTRHTMPDPAYCISIEDALRLLGWKVRWFWEQIRKNQIRLIHTPKKGRNGKHKVLGIAPSDLETLSPEAYQAWLLEREREAEERLAEAGSAEKETNVFITEPRRLSLVQIERKHGPAKLVALLKEGEQLLSWEALPRPERVRELLAQGKNETWFRRRLKLYKAFGPAGLVRPESFFKGKRRSVPLQLEEFIRDLRLTRKHAGVQALYETIQEHAQAQADAAPSLSTVRRVIKSIPNSVDCRARRGVKAYRDKYEPIVRRGRVSAPGLVFCADHHELDLASLNYLKKSQGLDFVKGTDRLWITGTVDLYDNRVVGWVLTWQPNSQSIALALRQAFLTRGICEELLIDNGRDYVSSYIEAVCASLHIKIRKCERYHGQSKPLERWFRILEERLVSELPGYLGNKPANRPENAKASLDLVEVEKIIALWNSTEYCNLKSKALGNRSPNELWSQALADGHVPRVPDVRALDLLLMPTRERKIYKDGIHLFGFYFWNDALTPLINDTDESGENRKVEVRFDPACLGEVHVFHEGKFFCTARSQPLADWGASKADLETVQHKRKYASEFFKNYMEAARIGHSGQELVKETVQQRLERMQAAQQQMEMPKAVGQNNVHTFLGPFDSAARSIARGEGRPDMSSPSKRQPHEVSQEDFGTPDENGVPECPDHREMLKRYRKRNLLHVLPVRYLDPNRELEHQIWEPEKLSEDVRRFFTQRGLYKDE